MKRLITTALALLLILCSFASAFAMEVPTKTVIQNLNGTQQYIKVYTVSPYIDPESIIEQDFSYEGFDYTYSDMTKSDNYFENEKEHSEVITAETGKKDLSAVLEALPPSIDFDDGIYTGILYLDHTTIETKAAGFVSKSYTVSDTREFANLDSNDMAYVPQAVTKDGKTLQLVGVDWQVQSTALVDDLLVPASYKAVAQYSTKASYSAATGYISTATYSGKVSCNELESVTYTVTYVGTETPAEEEPEVVRYGLFKDRKSLIIGCVLFVMFVVAGVFAVLEFIDFWDKREKRKKAERAKEKSLVASKAGQQKDYEKEEKKCEGKKYF
ncbi:MAG: hypothetical protein IJK95_06270 [Firmicutes bacterium]|nr:hypothetical protein [Bacillota bacterium]